MTHDLQGRRALVTGGGSGIGLACVHELAGRGAHVVVADVSEEAASAAVAAVTARGGSATADVSAPAGVAHNGAERNGAKRSGAERNGAERSGAERNGAERSGAAGASGSAEAWVVDLADTAALDTLALDVDILVNNAGVQRVSPIEALDPEAFRLIQRLMLEAPFLLIRAALPGMYERGWGRIINLSSVHGLRASPFKSAYVAAKHGLEGLSKVTALEGGAHGVTSNCVNPGYVRTPLVERQVADQARVHGIPESEVVERVMLTESAVKRLVEPAEVASLVGWLASDRAGMATGASYTMDGGWSAR